MLDTTVLIFNYYTDMTFKEYYKYLFSLVGKLPECDAKEFYLNRLSEIYFKNTDDDPFVLWSAVRDDLFTFAQHGDTRTFTVIDGELMTLGIGWEKIIKSEYDSYLNCFLQPSNSNRNKAICKCGNYIFEVSRIDDTPWSVWIKCTKCGEEYEYASE